jgi:hypothetical protein
LNTPHIISAQSMLQVITSLPRLVTLRLPPLVLYPSALSIASSPPCILACAASFDLVLDPAPSRSCAQSPYEETDMASGKVSQRVISPHVVQPSCSFRLPELQIRAICHHDTMSIEKYSDAILPMQEPYISQIVNGTKNYEFRKYRIRPDVRRVWFYLNKPDSCIKYICEITPAQTRNKGDPPLKEDGLGNQEFNTRHKAWNGYDYAYKILSLYELYQPISLSEMRSAYNMKCAPRGLVFVPDLIKQTVGWNNQKQLREQAHLP